jgi:hydrogenase-4 component E
MTVPPPSEVGYWLAGVALSLSLVVLAARRPGLVLGAYAAQATVLALAAGWQAWLQASLPLAAAALVTFGAKGVGVPLLLRPAFRDMRLAPGGWIPLALGAGLATLSAAIAPRDLAPALAMTLLGLLTIASRHARALRAMGLLSLENGVALAAFGAVGLPAFLSLTLASLGVITLIAAHLAPAGTRPA